MIFSTSTGETEISKGKDEPYFKKSEDLISRKAVLDFFKDYHYETFTAKRLKEFIEKLSTIPQTYEWCHDCKEYDTEKHCCHRYSSFIRESLQDKVDSVLEDIKAEIASNLITHGQVIEGEYFSDDAENINYGLKKALEIIDKHISRKE